MSEIYSPTSPVTDDTNIWLYVAIVMIIIVCISSCILSSSTSGLYKCYNKGVFNLAAGDNTQQLAL